MSTVSIRGKLIKDKKAEFYLTIETVKSLIEKNCEAFSYNLNENNELNITIDFSDQESLKNFDKLEFSILKGSIRSLCYDVEVDTHLKME